MTDSTIEVPWTEEQWSRVRQVVRDEARAARVAGNILPLVGPLAADASYVSAEDLIEPNVDHNGEKVSGFTVDDTGTLKLSTLQARVFLRSAQIADPQLSSALTAFRRAANVLAHLEDEIVFNGQTSTSTGMAPRQSPGGRALSVGGRAEVEGGEEIQGLAGGFIDYPVPDNLGERLVSEVSHATGELEARFHPGPFACVLGHEYFQAIQTPNNSLVLPQDRILPFLAGGPLARCSSLSPSVGLVIALAGAPIDLVMATEMTVEFLQTTASAWSVFRVYEKMVLRIKQADAIEQLKPPTTPRVRPRRRSRK